MNIQAWRAGLFAALAVLIGAIEVPDARAQSSSVGNGTDLSLSAYLQNVVQDNTTIEQGRLQWLIKASQAAAQWGAFEPSLTGSFKATGLKQQNTALELYQQLGTPIYDEHNQVYSLSLDGKLPIGTKYNVGTSVTRLENTYVEQGQYKTFAGVTVTQPLLKGLTHQSAMAGIHASFDERIIAFHQYRKQLMSTIAKAESAYWKLALAQDAEKMAKDAVRTAQYLLSVATEGVRLGKASNLDLRQAQAELASRQSDESNSQLAVSDAEMQVRLLMGSKAVSSRPPIVATDPFLENGEQIPHSAGETDALVSWAYRAQPDYMIALQEFQRQKTLVAYGKDQALPELNLTGSYGYTGLGKTVADSLDSADSGNYPTWSVGVEMKLPLFLGVKQQNDLKAAELAARLADVKIQNDRETLKRAIENLAHDVGTLTARIKNAQSVSTARKELLDIAVARYKEGNVTLVDVYNAEDALNKARQQELSTIADYRQAVAQLEMVSGSVLKNQGLEKLQGNEVVLSESLRTK